MHSIASPAMEKKLKEMHSQKLKFDTENRNSLTLLLSKKFFFCYLKYIESFSENFQKTEKRYCIGACLPGQRLRERKKGKKNLSLSFPNHPSCLLLLLASHNSCKPSQQQHFSKNSLLGSCCRW